MEANHTEIYFKKILLGPASIVSLVDTYFFDTLQQFLMMMFSLIFMVLASKYRVGAEAAH
jgi:hypothetical protein